MAHNSAKMNWTLEELGWTLHEAGDVHAWDGLMEWFVNYAATHPISLTNSSVRQWHAAALQLAAG